MESSSLKGGYCWEWWSSENRRLRMGNATQLSLITQTCHKLRWQEGWRTWARAAEVPLGTDNRRAVPLLRALFPPCTTSSWVNVGSSYLEAIILVHLCPHDMQQGIPMLFRPSACPTFASEKQPYEGRLFKGISKTLSIVSFSPVHVPMVCYDMSIGRWFFVELVCSKKASASTRQ